MTIKQKLVHDIKALGLSLGFQQVAISDVDVHAHADRLDKWLDKGFHGEMSYMLKHKHLRRYPQQLHENTKRIITVRMNHLPFSKKSKEVLDDPNKAYISRYALGKDYHRLIRKRLQQYAEKICQIIGPFGYRAFTDSAPILEKALAEKSGLGWIGKHSLLINKSAGSWFFLGELFVDIELPVDEEVSNHCGSCTACIDVCPSKAIVAPYQLDARKCISYLTIEHRGYIDESLRPFIGNRIFGCDDCQLVCPWNKYAQISSEALFQVRHNLDDIGLSELFALDEDNYQQLTAGSPIRRVGYNGWLRNIAIALGNAPFDVELVKILQEKKQKTLNDMVLAHIDWALESQRVKQGRHV